MQYWSDDYGISMKLVTFVAEHLGNDQPHWYLQEQEFVRLHEDSPRALCRAGWVLSGKHQECPGMYQKSFREG